MTAPPGTPAEGAATVTATKPLTAADVARGYLAVAAWVPFWWKWPPTGSPVEVLYGDGVIHRVRRAADGNLIVVDTGSRYLNAEQVFWRPIPAE